MSQAIHLYTDHASKREWFECSECGTVEAFATELWREVEVLGPKPTLRCPHEPHLPPSPSALREHHEAFALGMYPLYADRNRIP